MLLVSCRTGGEHIYVAPEDQNRDPHSRMDANGCTHCADGHGPDVHCGMMANLCSQEHPPAPGGDPDVHCWQGDGERPDGCTVCRPLLIELMPGTVSAQGVSQ